MLGMVVHAYNLAQERAEKQLGSAVCRYKQEAEQRQ